MLCCFQPWSDPASAYDTQTSDGLSGFPGQRREFVKTAGNALAAAPLQDTNQPDTPMAQSIQPQEKQAEGELVSVTVPAGSQPGDTIHIKHPDGSGRLISAQIPQGMVPDSIFYVRSPPRVEIPPPIASPVGVTAPVKSPNPQPASMPMAQAEPVNPYSDIQAVQPPPPFSQCLDSPEDTPPAHQADHPVQSTPPAQAHVQSSSDMSLMKVTVPPGATAGSTIHVQVPGENRRIAAQIPPNCTEFHVQYQPQRNNSTNMQAQSPPLQAPVGQKLLKVQVPPGSSSGDVLHVRIPDEPDRLIKVQVPAGNVQEFNVAYQPRASTLLHYASTSGSNKEWGAAAALPIVGGLATAAAGAMVIDHFAS